MSTFGKVFRVTTFGESHCKGVGAIVDGVPSGLNLVEDDIQPQLTRRRPGQSKLTTPRDEKDKVTIMSGTERGHTLGTPIGLFVPNENVRPQDYKEMSTVPRPGHADYTYQMKYGTRASSGGGRASARETIGRVAAGAIAEKYMKETYGTEIVAWVSSIGTVDMPVNENYTWNRQQVDTLGTITILRDPSKWQILNKEEYKNEEERMEKQKELDAKYEEEFLSNTEDLTSPAYIDQNNIVYTRNGDIIENPPSNINEWKSEDIIPVRCPHGSSASKMSTLVRQIKSEKDSTGGIITCVIRNVPIGLGEPCFDKMEAMLAHAMLSLPATKGFEVGSGFDGVRLRGSEHNDPFCKSQKQEIPILKTTKNHAGGILGGITSGEDIYFRVAIKPVSTIGQAQETVDYQGNSVVLEAKGRHDPCVLPRAVPLVESMAALVLADAALIQTSRAHAKNSITTIENHISSIENSPKKQKVNP